MELYLSQEQCREIPLDIKGQKVAFLYLHVRPLRGLRAQAVVIAGEYHLHEVRVVQTAVLIRVKELNEVVAVRLCHLVDLVVSQIVQEFHRHDEAILISIDTLKQGVRFHVLIAREVLSLQLNVKLTFGNAEQ